MKGFPNPRIKDKVCIHDDLPTDLRDSPIDLSTLLDAIGCGEATPKKSGKPR